MKLLVYSHVFPPSIGGVETIVRVLAAGLASRGVDVTVATPTPAGPMNDSEFGFTVVRLSGRWQLVHLIREADVIHLAGPALAPLALGLLLRKPVVVEHHGYQSACPNGLLFFEPTGAVCPGHFQAAQHRECLRCNARQGYWRSLRMWALTFPRRWLCRKVAANIAISLHAARRTALPHSMLIYHGIADPAEAGAGPRGNSGQPGQACFAYVGRMVSIKGVPVLIRAAAQLKRSGRSFRLLFVGAGPERESLERMARESGLGDCATFAGALTGGALARAVEDASSLVMPSIWEELFGLAAIEQMMRGKTLIVSDIGGLAEVVGDAALKFPPGDSQQLTACMQSVIDAPDTANKLAADARRRALTLFAETTMIDNHLRLYRSLCEPDNRRARGEGLGREPQP
ncbi:MAG TPA: glycosyltransferase family 4 protein [Candidatus Acidoferrales bacterium]|nr:glycosyltransferase family 4 protein [Candidatus Acidoferrales bacterium]